LSGTTDLASVYYRLCTVGFGSVDILLFCRKVACGIRLRNQNKEWVNQMGKKQGDLVVETKIFWGGRQGQESGIGDREIGSGEQKMSEFGT